MDENDATLMERLPLVPSLNKWLLKPQSPGFKGIFWDPIFPEGGQERSAGTSPNWRGSPSKPVPDSIQVFGKRSHAGGDGKTLTWILLQVTAERIMNLSR